MSLETAVLLDHGLWRVDGPRSAIEFRVRHFGVATLRGRFESFAGHIDAGEGGLLVNGHVDVGSVETGNAIRDARLRSEFFDAELHPAIWLRAHDADGGSRLCGELTIRGLTRLVELEMTLESLDDGAVRVRAETKIRRSDFGLEWEALRDAGRVLVADEVRLVADVVLTSG
jgi:polyisoprenoid-binding protein YceI